MHIYLKKEFFATAVAAALVAGCASTRHLKEAESHYFSGQYADAAISASQKLPEEREERSRTDYILDNLYAGSALLMDGDFSSAADSFKHAADGIAEQDDSTFGGGYPTRTYDVSMAANYRALALWADGNADSTRVAFRQTATAQDRANERNARAIRKAEDDAEKRKTDETNRVKRQASENGEPIGVVLSSFMNAATSGAIQKQIESYEAEYATWHIYSDFQVPSTWFLDGLFALANAEEPNDLEHASFSARKALRIVPSDPAKAIYSLAELRADGKIAASELDNYFAVVFENGLGPRIDERRFDIPMSFNGCVYMLSFALPKLVTQGLAYQNLIVRDGAVQIGNTVSVGQIDPVVTREFKSRLPVIAASQLFEAVLKLAVQVAVIEKAKEKGGDQAAFFVSLATAATSSAITGTDTRHWNLLPKEVQACVLQKPKTADRMVELWVPGAVTPLAKVSLPEKGLSVIYVKVPAPGLPPLVRLLGQSHN